MKIAMFSDTYVPQRNGVSTAVKLYKDKLEERGHEVYVFVPRYSKEEKRNEKNVIEYPAIRYVLEKEQRIAIFHPYVPFKIKKMEFDIIHTHTPFSMGILAFLSAKLFDIPYIGTHHTMYEYYRHYLPPIIRPSLKMTKALIREWCKKLDKVIAPTTEVKNVLVSYGVPEDHIVVIPTGIDVEKFQEPPKYNIKEMFDIEDGKKIILYVGRLGKEKNIPFLMKVFSKVRKREDAVFLLIGYGPELESLEFLAEELGIENDVIFAGKQDREIVIDAYKQADVFVFASYTETQGLVIIEAMAAGLPIVALGKLGVKDLLEGSNGGIMLPELNEEEFSEAILKLLNDQKLHKTLGENGKKYVMENFSIDITIDKLLEVYHEFV